MPTLTPQQVTENYWLLVDILVKMEELINKTPTGETRNSLTDANIILMSLQNPAQAR